MREPTERSDSERLAEALRHVRGVDVCKAQLLAGDMRPLHLDGVRSDCGRVDLSASSEQNTELTGALPDVHSRYGLGVDGFIGAFESALSNEVAGYALRLNERGLGLAATRSIHAS
jgi:hypothetical protein